MPKSKDFFSLLKTQGRISEPKFDELIEKVPDFEIPQEAVQAFEENFMTIERAATHPEVNKKIRYQVLTPIDRDLEKIINVISSIDKPTGERLESLTRDGSANGAVGSRVPDTYKRTDLLANSLSELFNKVKAAPAGGDEELKKKLKEKDTAIQEWADKLAQAQKDFTETIKKEKDGFETKLHDYKLDSELEKLSGTFTLAEAYEKNRPAINKVILSELKSTNTLKLGTKDGQTVINVLDERGEPRFNGNSPVTINQLLEEKHKPFLKQSNADTDKNQSSQSRTVTVQGNQNPSIRRGVSTTVK